MELCIPAFWYSQLPWLVNGLEHGKQPISVPTASAERPNQFVNIYTR